MATMIQIRNVPDDLHRLLKARAALAGTSLSEYLLAELRLCAERPTLTELRERLLARRPCRLSVGVAHAVREEREAR